MRIVVVDPREPASEPIEEAAEVLRTGGVVGLPTETFYGLAVDPLHPGALAQLNRIKGKPDDAPVLLLAADPTQVGQVAACGGRMFDLLAREFWPGPLTLVLPALADAPAEIAPGRGTVAVRVPGLALPRQLAARLGRPISGVSANRHGQPPCSEAGDVAKLFPDEVALVLDGGAAAARAPSTILDLTAAAPRILRRGELPESALRRFLP